jgi:hypothetical protein|tara:strand:- start:792 stop:1040 length:249 start_codon:yes stop_codon:yes gene_type:complete
MKQKMINLDDETYAMAGQMSNFSGWVRRMLKLRANGTDAVQLYRDKTAWAAAVNSEEDEEVRARIYARVQENKQQKRLGEFE